MRKEGILIKKTGSRAPPTISFPAPVLVPALPLASSSDPEAATRFLAPATLGLSVDPSANQLALPRSFPSVWSLWSGHTSSLCPQSWAAIINCCWDLWTQCWNWKVSIAWQCHQVSRRRGNLLRTCTSCPRKCLQTSSVEAGTGPHQAHCADP